MAHVEFYRLQDDGSQKTIAVCRLVDGTAICEGDTALVALLAREGVPAPGKPEKILHPADGLAFLEALSYNFSSGYLNASKVIDG